MANEIVVIDDKTYMRLENGKLIQLFNPNLKKPALPVDPPEDLPLAPAFLTTWAAKTSGSTTESYNRVASNDEGIFYCCTAAGVLRRSLDDGETWALDSTGPSGVAQSMNRVMYGGGGSFIMPQYIVNQPLKLWYKLGTAGWTFRNMNFDGSVGTTDINRVPLYSYLLKRWFIAISNVRSSITYLTIFSGENPEKLEPTNVLNLPIGLMQVEFYEAMNGSKAVEFIIGNRVWKTTDGKRFTDDRAINLNPQVSSRISSSWSGVTGRATASRELGRPVIPGGFANELDVLPSYADSPLRVYADGLDITPEDIAAGNVYKPLGLPMESSSSYDQQLAVSRGVIFCRRGTIGRSIASFDGGITFFDTGTGAGFANSVLPRAAAFNDTTGVLIMAGDSGKIAKRIYNRHRCKQKAYVAKPGYSLSKYSSDALRTTSAYTENVRIHRRASDNALIFSQAEASSAISAYYISKDEGATWTGYNAKEIYGFSFSTISASMLMIRANDGKWIAGGGNHSTSTFVSFAMSDDGVTWSTPRQIAIDSTGKPVAAVYSPTLGYYLILMSTGYVVRWDGSATGGIMAVARPASNNSFSTGGWIDINPETGVIICGGAAGLVYTTTNGTNWTSKTPFGTSTIVQALKFIDGMWVGIGNSTVYISTNDGTTWTSRGVINSRATGTPKDIVKLRQNAWAVLLANGNSGSIIVLTKDIATAAVTNNDVRPIEMRFNNWTREPGETPVRFLEEDDHYLIVTSWRTILKLDKIK